MKNNKLEDSIYRLIEKCSTTLTKDISSKIKLAVKTEKNVNALSNLSCMIENIKIAEKGHTPLCQDTGFLNFFVTLKDLNEIDSVRLSIKKSVARATKDGLLRPNLVNTISNKNTNNNLGDYFPNIYFEKGKKDEIILLLKGGGSENASCQHSLPIEAINANRDIDGVKRCILNSICEIQGKGCSPGIIGVCIGGDRSSGYLLAKKQLLRRINDKTKTSKFEKLIMDEANKLGIGPMGLGGNTTLLACKVIFAERHIATYYVTISYMCWADRRNGILLNNNGSISKWLY